MEEMAGIIVALGIVGLMYIIVIWLGRVFSNSTMVEQRMLEIKYILLGIVMGKHNINIDAELKKNELRNRSKTVESILEHQMVQELTNDGKYKDIDEEEKKVIKNGTKL